MCTATYIVLAPGPFLAEAPQAHEAGSYNWAAGGHCTQPLQSQRGLRCLVPAYEALRTIL